jgi:hypothetical protein
MASLYPPGSVVSVRGLLLGERIDLKGLEATQRLGTNFLIAAGEVTSTVFVVGHREAGDLADQVAGLRRPVNATSY